jgi:regulatory protein SWI5
MEATIKPSQRKGNQRARNIFQEMRDHAELNAPSSPRGTLLQASNSCDSARMPPSNFLNMTNLNMDFMNNEGYESSYYSPTTSNTPPELSQHSSPEISQMPLFGDPFRNKPDLEAPDNSHYVPISQNSLNRYQTTSPEQRSPHNRSLSVDSINLEETITETGITGEDIACYIDGPDPVDQKWLCLYPECKKRFGRKENIKSHVQTHLGDRQYQCPHCKKCFVRQHDLKRHAKIHSGVKPYPCLCGNSFARHDALTRHRQRGMCIGAFEDVVKKVVKRGRPRKARPDAEERQDKASRTRNKNKAMSSASSTSGLSDGSYAQTPPCDFDILNDKPFGDFTSEFSQPSTVLDSGSFQYSTEHSPLPIDCVSPQVIQSAPSPSALSTHSQHSHFSQDHASQHNLIANIGEQQSHKFSHPSSPTKSHISYNPSSYNTPPELCLSSSSPPLSSKLYDPPSQPGSQDMDLSRLAHFELQNSSHEDDVFLNAFENRIMGLSRLEEDPGLLLMDGKFENTFGIVEQDEGERGMFGEDVFFGSP